MSANILTDVANPRTRIMPLEEKQRMKAKIDLDRKDMNGDSPEYSREMKKHLIKNPEGSNEANKNENRINVRRMETVLKRQGDRSLTKVEIASLEKRAQILKTEMRKMMVPVEDTQLTPSLPGGASNPAFHKARNAMAKGEMSPKFREKAHELKNILRLLGRDDPDAGNFENFRPSRGEV